MGDTVVRALDGVDLDIEQGEFVAITGASGSGKSTMMHLLGCLDRPTSGHYVLDGRDVSGMSDRQLAAVRNKRIGFVFQTFNLINRTSAVDNVGVPLFYARKSDVREPARRALERVGLGKRSGHRPSELSGGERQRVAIARAIVNDPVLLLADEPTGNLDTKTGEQIMRIFHDLNEQGVTVVLVTHEPDVAVQARRIVQMRDGRIVSDRPVSDEERRRVLDHAAQQPPAIHLPPDDGGEAEAMPDGHPGVEPGDADRLPVAARAASGPPPGSMPARPPRMVSGATAALICAVIAPLLAVAAYVGGKMVAGEAPKQGQMPSREFLIVAFAAFVAMVLAVLLGIAAVVLAWRALRRLRKAPEPLTGEGRARTAMILGSLAILSPAAMFVIARLAGSPPST